MEEPQVACRKVGNTVMLRGRPTRTGDDETGRLIASLPDGFWPAEECRFQVESSTGSVMVTITPDGSILGDLPVGDWLVLDGISFAAA
jgi:hypothetical protein